MFLIKFMYNNFYLGIIQRHFLYFCMSKEEFNQYFIRNKII